MLAQTLAPEICVNTINLGAIDTDRQLARYKKSQSLLSFEAAQAYAGFNAAKDPDLIESYVFEINALQARYSYLLRRVKELDGEAQAQPG